MGFYLRRGTQVERRYGLSQWPAILRLARAFGWKATGTTIDEQAGVTSTKKWSGSYEAMAHQWVSAQDANNLADAIERTLVYFPRQDEEKTLAYQVKTNRWGPPNKYEEEALRWFFKDAELIITHEMSLADFVAYCREGAFEIF